MAAEFNVISKKFYNQLWNGDNFTLNLAQFTPRLQGNEGELLKLVEEIEVKVAVNENKAIRMRFDYSPSATYGIFSSDTLDFIAEGLWNGAVVDIAFDNTIVSSVNVGFISGQGNTQLNVDKTLLTPLLKDGEIRSDVTIYLVTAPKYLQYNYGINSIDDSAPNYRSPLDTNEQAYYAFDIPTSPTTKTMTWKGNQQGADLGTVDITYDSTTNYFHKYTLEHVFRLPFYKAGEQTNFITSCRPKRFAEGNTMKYGNGFFFGGVTSDTAAQFEDLGGRGRGAGNVGYFGENFNGFKNNYSIDNLSIANSLGTNTLEATVSNRVTFDIVNNVGTWGASRDVILTHSKFPDENEYANQKESFNDVFILEGLRGTEGGAPTSGTLFSNFQVTLDASFTKLQVAVDIAYSAPQQQKLSNTTDVALWVTVADQNLTNPDQQDRGNVPVFQGQTGKDETVSGLITAWQPNIFEHWNYDAGVKFFTNFDGYDGDLLGQTFTFETDLSQSARISKAIFRVVADNGSSYFPLYQQLIPFNKIAEIDVGGTLYQAYNYDSQNDFNFPSTEELNRITMKANIPGAPTATQSWEGSIGFTVPWRDWIANTAVPNTFLDYNELNDNKNERSSNYSGISGYTIKTILSVVVQNSSGATTEYDLLSDSSSILQINDPGASTFSKVYQLYDSNNDLTQNLSKKEDIRIEIEFDHTTGIIPLANIQGFIAIEPKNGTGRRWYLSTDKDFTNLQNPLQPSNVVTPGNTQFVEIKSVSNKVTLICETNRFNLSLGTEYNIYGRLGNKI